MKCPHCAKSIGLFSPEMTALHKSGTCPQCGKGARIGIIYSRFALGFLAVAIPAFLLGLSGPIAAGIAGGVGALFGLGLTRTGP
ncbi:MAG: hypothetical protein QM776_15715 [Rhodocyclaceae bacterium]